MTERDLFLFSPLFVVFFLLLACIYLTEIHEDGGRKFLLYAGVFLGGFILIFRVVESINPINKGLDISKLRDVGFTSLCILGALVALALILVSWDSKRKPFVTIVGLLIMPVLYGGAILWVKTSAKLTEIRNRTHTYVVRDEQGNPITGYSSSSHSGEESCEFTVSKEGYYQAKGWVYARRVLFVDKPAEFATDKVVVLKKIQKPHPMVMFREYLAVPAHNKWVGFDLLLCDWVAPQGKGAVSDIAFYFERANATYSGTEKWRLRFPGAEFGNGYKRYPDANAKIYSEFLPPVMADPDGYLPSDEEPNSCYMLEDLELERCHRHGLTIRFRGKAGLPDSAYYGYLTGEFSFRKREDTGSDFGGEFLLSYVVNVNPGERNLEWDKSTNLRPDQQK